MKSSLAHLNDEPTAGGDGTEFDDDVTVGIVEGNLVMGETLRMAMDSSQDTRCVGLWSCAKDFIGDIRERRPLVVLMDLDLPGTAGIDATALLKRDLPEIQMVILSNDPDPERIAEAVKAGAAGYLVKPTLASLLGSLAIAAPFDADRMILVKARKVIEIFHSRTPRDKLDRKRDSISPREKEVARLISEGLSNKEIASHLNVAAETARTHTRNIFKKFSVRTRTEVAVRYLKSQPQWNSEKG